jgi:hypothetical protein
VDILWIYGAGQDREGKKTTRTPTTRYVTLLSVVLALALTAALAACGSDEPSGVTGPDRTASTPGSGDAPTATNTLGSAAATAPTLGPTSAETDREALVALYNATDGENWNRPGSGDAPTATNTLGSAAATAPTLGPTSAETDREALVALYNATDEATTG